MAIPERACERAGCTNLLHARQKRYCSNACRAISEAEKKRTLADSVALAEVRELVGPVVRDVLSESILKEISVLTHLLPEALERLQKIIQGEDDVEARQAIALLMKYTIGAPAAQPKSEDSGAPAFNINFGSMPQQGDSVADTDGSVLEVVPEDAEELRACLECGESKPPEEFVGESNRCEVCHAQILENIRAQHPGMLPSGA